MTVLARVIFSNNFGMLSPVLTIINMVRHSFLGKKELINIMNNLL